MGDIAFAADGVPIHFEVQGQGIPALVFIHGWSCDRSYWHKQVNHFASQYTVVAIDLAGHGSSGQNRNAWTMAAFGQDVVAVVEQLGLTQVVLIGHSMGGIVMLEAARQMPTRVIGLVGADTLKNPERNPSQADIDARIAPFQANFVHGVNEFVRGGMFVPTSDTAWIETIVEDMASAPPHVGIGALQELFGYNEELREALRAVQAPIVLINADFQPTNVAATERFGMTVEFMSGVGHFVMMEDAETFNDLLEKAVWKMRIRSAE